MATENALQLVTLTVAALLRDRMQRQDVGFTFSRPYFERDKTAHVPRLNLYLYQLMENPAFRNEEEPPRAINGQHGHPPLALSLSYLITSYGKPIPIEAPEDSAAFPNDSLAELDSQFVLADAMRVLHDFPIITRTTARLGPGTPLLMDPGLQQDFESIRIVPRQLALEELTKIWTAFKEDFQRSVGYDITVVRIERPRPNPANPPVLRRNITALPRVSPTLSIALEEDATVTDTNVYFTGSGLGDPSLRILVSDASRLGFPANPLQLTPQADAHGTFFQLPSANPQMQPGPKLVQAVITAPPPGLRPIASTPVPLTLQPNLISFSPTSGPFDGVTEVTLSGTALGIEPADPQLPPSPMTPIVLFGGYAIPAADLDLSGLPTKIVATLNPGRPGAPAPPSGTTPIPVRVRVNGVENQSWKQDPITGNYSFLTNLQYTPS